MHAPCDYPAAERLAARLHADDTDKAGAPYIGHLQRVAARVTLLDGDEDTRVAAVLHDAVEDAKATLEELRAAGVSERALAMIDAVTRRDGESYDEFVARAAAVEGADLVKYADMEDNLDPHRLSMLEDELVERLAFKYVPHLGMLHAQLSGRGVPLRRLGR